MKTTLQSKIIWFALVVSQLLLGFLVTTLANSGRQPTELIEAKRQILIGLGALDWLFAWTIPTVFLRSMAARAKTLTPENIHVISIVQWALFESVTLFGFIIANHDVSVQPMLPFLAAGLLGMVLHFPSERRASKLSQAFETYRVR